MSANQSETARLVCRSYTAAHRFPLRIGEIQGAKLRVALTPVQLATLVVTFVVMVASWPLWARFGVLGNGACLLGLPFGLGWLMRKVRVEGRAPWRFAVGLVTYAGLAGHDVRLGRRQPARVPERIMRARLPVRSR